MACYGGVGEWYLLDVGIPAGGVKVCVVFLFLSFFFNVVENIEMVVVLL